MKQKILFVLIGAIALMGLSSCESVYDMGKEESEVVLGYRIISKNLVSVEIFDFETGKDFCVDSLSKADWNLYVSSQTTSLAPVTIKSGKFAYQDGMSIPLEGSNPEATIGVQIGGLEFPFDYKGNSHVLKPIQPLWIVVGEMEEYKSSEDEVNTEVKSEDDAEKRYTVTISLVAENLFTGEDIVLAQKTHLILLTDKEQIIN